MKAEVRGSKLSALSGGGYDDYWPRGRLMDAVARVAAMFVIAPVAQRLCEFGVGILRLC